MMNYSSLVVVLCCFSSQLIAEKIDLGVNDIKPHIVKGRREVAGAVETPDSKKYRGCSFDFSHCPDGNNRFIRFDLNRTLPGKPVKLLWSIKPVSNVSLAVWFKDRSGEIYLSRRNVVKSDAWQAIDFSVPSSPAWHGGDGNGQLDLPVTLLGISAEQSGESKKGEFLLGECLLLTDLSKGNPFSTKIDFPRYSWGDDETPGMKLTIRNYARLNLKPAYAKVFVYDLYGNKQILEKKIAFVAKDSNKSGVGVAALNLPYGSFQLRIVLYYGKKELSTQKINHQHFMGDCGKEQPLVLAYEKRWSPLGGVWGFMTPAFANKFGVRWSRFEGPNWSDVERSLGVYDTASIAKAAQECSDYNIRPIVLQTLYAHPKFRNPADLPEFSSGYGRAMMRIAGALKGKTRYFELGNEDNGERKFMYTEIGRNGAAGIRSVQPFAVIANSGTAFIDHSWLGSLVNHGLFEYLDAFCVHPYTNNSTPSQEVSAEKSMTLANLERLNDLVDISGGMKELWNTEFGWPNSNPQGEMARADLYLREIFVNAMANMRVVGVYTFKRDYGTVDYPVGPAINAYANLRAGHRFVGFIRDGNTWCVVYEKSGDAFAAVWTPENTPSPLTITGNDYLDIFGNKLSKRPDNATQAPIYVTGLDKSALKLALRSQCERLKSRLDNCLRLNSKSTLGRNLMDVDPMNYSAIRKTLLKWAGDGSVATKADTAIVGRMLDWYLAASRFRQDCVMTGKFDLNKEMSLDRKKIMALNKKGLDLPGLRYLLRKRARVDDEKNIAIQAGRKKYAAACFDQERVIMKIAERFRKVEEPFQFAVFANLYADCKPDAKEDIVFIPGEWSDVAARVSSYSTRKEDVTVIPKVPEGWTCEPASRTIGVNPLHSEFINFRIKCPKVTRLKHPIIQVVTSIKGKPDVVALFDRVEILPPLKIEILPINIDISKSPVQIELYNCGEKTLSGNVRFNLAEVKGAAIARLNFNSLKPHQKRVVPLKIKKIFPSLRKKWIMNAVVSLDDGRRFDTDVKLDFTLAVRAPVKMSIDNDLSEWKNALPLKLDRCEYTRGSYGNAWSPEDCSAVSYLMWDEKFLYFAAVVRDQTFNQRFDRDSMWKQDSVQIIFAKDLNGKTTQFTIALTPTGPKIWMRSPRKNGYLKNAPISIAYRNKSIIYEAAIPWSVFGPDFDRNSFLYAIAVNDDDAIVGRRFLERFKGSIIHGKNVATFERVNLFQDGVSDFFKCAGIGSNVIFYEDFESDAPGSTPGGWRNVRNFLPPKSTIVLSDVGIGNSQALRLRNMTGHKPNHFDIFYVSLKNLLPEKKYQLEFQVKGIVRNSKGLIGFSSDVWGNESYTYASWTPSEKWQKVKLDIKGPLSGRINLIIRNVSLTEKLFVDNIKITKE